MPRGETSNCFVLVGLNGIWDETDVVYPTPDGTSSDVARFPNTEMDEGDEFKVVWLGETTLDWTRAYGWAARNSGIGSTLVEGTDDRIKTTTSGTFTVTLTDQLQVWAMGGGSK